MPDIDLGNYNYHFSLAATSQRFAKSNHLITNENIEPIEAITIVELNELSDVDESQSRDCPGPSEQKRASNTSSPEKCAEPKGARPVDHPCHSSGSSSSEASSLVTSNSPPESISSPKSMSPSKSSSSPLTPSSPPESPAQTCPSTSSCPDQLPSAESCLRHMEEPLRSHCVYARNLLTKRKYWQVKVEVVSLLEGKEEKTLCEVGVAPAEKMRTSGDTISSSLNNAFTVKIRLSASHWQVLYVCKTTENWDWKNVRQRKSDQDLIFTLGFFWNPPEIRIYEADYVLPLMDVETDGKIWYPVFNLAEAIRLETATVRLELQGIQDSPSGKRILKRLDEITMPPPIGFAPKKKKRKKESQQQRA